ncbi:MAG: hypothetical protein P8R42_03265 [Candidatus Binatia bacterium]|nr:hypothetical protein [Candidatus Binatia bacterium]
MPELPGGLLAGETFATKLGGITIARCEYPAVFWVQAEGAITPPLLREDLLRAEVFAAEHPHGWTYVADVTRVRVVHPMNVFELRRIPGLAHLTQYVIVTPCAVQRWLIRRGRRFVSPDALVDTSAEAWALCESPLTPRGEAAP